jgi:putative endonuclease
MSRARVILGETGETLACEELQRRGYAIVARNYRRRSGEIDIIALDAQTLVFVEVKTRAGAEYGGAAEAVTWTKRRRLSATAADFIVRYGFADRACRFDVVTVSVEGEQPICEVYRNAFDAAASGGRR